MGNGLGCIPRTQSSGGIESRCKSSSRPRRKMITEEDLLHRQALAMAIQQHQLSQRFDGSMSRRIGSTSSRKQTPSSSFRKPAPTVLDNLETKKIILVHGEGFGAWCWYKILPLVEDAGLHPVALDLTGSGIDNTDVNSIMTLADYTKPLLDYLHNLTRFSRHSHHPLVLLKGEKLEEKKMYLLSKLLWMLGLLSEVTQTADFVISRSRELVEEERDLLQEVNGLQLSPISSTAPP